MEQVEQTAQEIGADKGYQGEDEPDGEGLGESSRVLEVGEDQHVRADAYPEAYKYVRGRLEQACAPGLALVRWRTLWIMASCSSLREEPTLTTDGMWPGATLLREALAFRAKLHLRLSLAGLAPVVEFYLLREKVLEAAAEARLADRAGRLCLSMGGSHLHPLRS